MNGGCGKYLQYAQWQWYWNGWIMVYGGYLQWAVTYIHMNDANGNEMVKIQCTLITVATWSWKVYT